jgi:predicted transcriptional regulator
MIAQQILNDSIPSLNPNESADRALHWMEFFKVSHLPIVEEQKFLGLLSDEAILNLHHDNLPISNCVLDQEQRFVYEDQHLYDVLLLMAQHHLSVIAVLNRKHEYSGSISVYALIGAIAGITSVDQSGSILVLKTGVREYSLSEIAQIVESHQVRILSSYIQTCPDQANMKITLKLNTVDLDSIKLTFERYNYKIDAVFAENGQTDELYKERLEAFLHYLNI